MADIFEVLLEKKGRGRGAFSLSRPWAVRTFKLSGQTLEYFDVDKLKGSLDIKNSSARKLSPDEADNKPFPFEVDVGAEKLILNASCEEIRVKCIDIFTSASKFANWGELQKQQTAAAAGVFTGQLAAADLKAAAAAEAEQKKAQQQEAANLFKGMGAKARFRAAVEAGNTFEAKIGAAMMLQGAWRSKVSRRKAAQKKAEKEYYRRNAMIRKIQSRYRVHLAKKRVQAVREKQMREAFAKSIGRQRGLIRFQNLVRVFLSVRRSIVRGTNLPTVVYAAVTSATGLSGNNSDPGVIVSGLSLSVGRNHPAVIKSQYKATDDVLKGGKTTSIYRGETVSSKKPLLACAASQLDYVVVTLVDRNSPNKDDALGQVFIRVSDIRRSNKVNADGSVDVTLPVQNHVVDIEDFAGKVTVRRAAAGSVTVNVRIAPSSYSMCGNLWKVSEKLLAGNAWKKRWFVLVDGALTYYNSELALEASKHVVVGSTVTSMVEEPFKGRNATKIFYTADGSSSFWQLDFDEDAPASLKRMWQRKLLRNFTAINDPEIDALKKKFTIVKSVSLKRVASARQNK